MIHISANLAVRNTVKQLFKRKRNELNWLNDLREITQQFSPQI